MTQKKTFVFDTPIERKYGASKGQILGYARVTGSAEYDADSHPFFDRDYCNISIDKVLIKVGATEADATLSYSVSKTLNDTFAEIIEDATYAHAEYVFEPLNKLQLPEPTDTDYQDDAMYHARRDNEQQQYEVTMIVDRPNEAA